MASLAPTAPIDYKTLVQDDRIHASLYTDPRIFDDELERIFHRGWVFVGHDSEIPRPGDFVTRHVGTEPVIMVRGKDGAVSVLVNRCMHRGTLVCPADRGNARTFSCPYHGWMKHRCAANWKALPENDSDGYHLGFVHHALFSTVRSQYQRVVGDERAIKAVVRDWGNGHIEIDWSPGYQDAFEWFGGASGSLVADFVAALERRDGSETARRRIIEGPAHALIFPNLFLGETNIAIVQPVRVEECVHWHTPMFWKGVPEFDGRLLRMSEAGVGPAAFLLPEDLIRSARNQAGLHASSR